MNKRYYMDTPIKEGIKDDRNTQEIPVKPDSRINILLEEEERRHTKHHRSPFYGDTCERCGFGHICEGKHHHRGCHRRRRWRKFKKTAQLLLLVMGICFFVALLLTYITDNLLNDMDRIISKNMEKAMQRTKEELLKGSPENLQELTKNIDIDKLKGQVFRDLGGWGGVVVEKNNHRMNIKPRMIT